MLFLKQQKLLSKQKIKTKKEIVLFCKTISFFIAFYFFLFYNNKESMLSPEEVLGNWE